MDVEVDVEWAWNGLEYPRWEIYGGGYCGGEGRFIVVIVAEVVDHMVLVIRYLVYGVSHRRSANWRRLV